MTVAEVAASRAEAKATGAVRYFTGKPCPHGHVADRWTKNGECVSCGEARRAAAVDEARVKARAVYAERRDVVLHRQRKAREADPERFKRNQANYCSRNRDKRLQSSREYYAKNRGKYLEYNRMRETGVKLATPAWVDRDAVEAVYQEAKRLEAETGLKYHVDHQVPIKGVNSKGEHVVCGLHVHYNLVPLTERENRVKSNRFEVI